MKEFWNMELLRKKQDMYMMQVKEELFSESSLVKDKIYKLFHLSQCGESLEIYVFLQAIIYYCIIFKMVRLRI